MWTGQEMTLADGLMISAVGLLVVFAALAALAIAVIIISKIINTAVKDKAPKQAAVAAAPAVIIISKVIGTLFKESAPKAAAAVAAPAPAIDEESYAVLLAAISEEARLSGEEFRVTSIKEL